MKLILPTLIAASLALSACSWQRKVTGSFLVENYNFTYVRTNTETANPLGDTEPDDYSYVLTMPDGTTRIAYSSESFSRYDRMRRIAREWVANNPRPTQPTASTNRTTGTSTTTTGTTGQNDSSGD